MERLIFLIFLKCIIATSDDLDYSSLEALGVACQPRDTCSGNANRSFSSSNCECDSWCDAFNDCCIDGHSSQSHRRLHGRPGITCLPLLHDEGAYAIGKCRNSWNGSYAVRGKCEGLDDFRDPLMSLPSTDARTNVTFRNHYCSQCNYATVDNTSFWDVTLTCSSLAGINTRFDITQDFIVRSITRLGSYWGVYHWNDTLAEMSFYPCEVSFHLPDHLRPNVRYCRPHVISTCASDWNRSAIRGYCSAYMAVIYVGDQPYRNAHCALCNRVAINNRTCDLTALTARKKPSLSFTLLLDVNQSDGDSVGETNRCISGHIYDPFFKRCRQLQCAVPGYVRIEDRCVPP